MIYNKNWLPKLVATHISEAPNKAIRALSIVNDTWHLDLQRWSRPKNLACCGQVSCCKLLYNIVVLCASHMCDEMMDCFPFRASAPSLVSMNNPEAWRVIYQAMRQLGCGPARHAQLRLLWTPSLWVARNSMISDGYHCWPITGSHSRTLRSSMHNCASHHQPEDFCVELSCYHVHPIFLLTVDHCAMWAGQPTELCKVDHSS